MLSGWTLIVVISIVITFLLAVRSVFFERRALIYFTAATALGLMGPYFGKFTSDNIWESLHESLPVILTIVVLEIFSLAIVQAEIPERLLKFIIGRFSLLMIQISLVFLTYVLSLVVNNLATILVVIPFVLRLGTRLNLELRPLLTALVIASNIGGASTSIGDFPNITIARETGLGFPDFVANLGFPLLCLFVPILGGVFFWHFRGVKRAARSPLTILKLEDVKRYYEFGYSRHKFADLRQGAIVGLFATMSYLIAKLPIDSLFVLLAFCVPLLFLINAKDYIFRDINVDVLVLFGSLFVIAGALKSTGVMEHLGRSILNADYFSPRIGVSFILISSAVMTAFVSAGPSTVMLIPMALIFDDVMGNGIAWWALSLGVLAGSSATPIGATAGPVTMSYFEKFTGGKFSFESFLRKGIPSAVLFLVASHIYLFVRLR